jgi:hypothetical protein
VVAESVTGYSIEQCEEILRVCPDGCLQLYGMIRAGELGLGYRSSKHSYPTSTRAERSAHVLKSWATRRRRAAALEEATKEG